MTLHKLDPQQHFTEPPPRYTEASLVKELEELGIGRPSTYVPIISTIQQRKYVKLENRRFVPLELGETVNRLMKQHFPDIVDVKFTAQVESGLDQVEDGEQEWTDLLKSFYGEFKRTLDQAEQDMERVERPVVEIGEACPECGSPLVIKTGRFGEFISCSNYPACTYSRQLQKKTGVMCPRCGARHRGAAQQARPRVLRLRDVSHVRLRALGQADAGAVPAVRRPGGSDDRAGSRC